MGGVGKTELAIQYVLQHEADYASGICWLSARESDLAASIVQFAQLHMKLEIPQQDFRGRALSLTEQVEWCWQHWQPPKGIALIILDDVTALGDYRHLLPKNNCFRILMTTRVRNLDPNIEEISLDVLSPQEALQLLIAIVGSKRVQKEQDVAQQLCEWLGYLPLGLELVGRYVAKKPPNWTLAHMLQQLKEQRLTNIAINQELQQTLSTAQRSVLDAFELSWQKLSPPTQLLAALLSLFAPNIIAWEWVESTGELLNWSSTDIETANEQLYTLHLIQSVDDTSGEYKIRIHPLICEFLKLKLAASQQADDLKRGFVEAMVAIAKTIPDSPTVKSINSVKDAIPHLAEVAQNLIDAVSDENLIWVFVGLDRFYSGQGLYTLAQPWLEQCVSVVQSRLGEEHPDVATNYNNLAELYKNQGRYSEAEPLYQKALELRQRLLGEEHPDVATSLNDLAELYRYQGRYAEAEPLYQQALEMRRPLLGEEHPDVATSLNNLALIYLYQGRYAEAEPLFQQTLTLDRRLVGEEHPYVATSVNNLALLYKNQGRYSEAEPLYQKALELRQRLLGEEHPDVAQSLYNLAGLYEFQERYSEAEPLLKKALELYKRLLGEEHHDVADCYNNLALLYESQGQYSEAEPLYQKALELYKRLLGEKHPDVATNYNNLAGLYKNQGRYSEAEPLYQKALELRQRLLGEEHPSVATSYNKLAGLYDALGRYSEAEPLYKKALEIAELRLGVDHPSTATIRENLKFLRDNYA
ncbi:MAG: tetratricopeptide repeat protein [Nostoc sp. LPT]|nr:tetratricopeptide repeat protein [Nostoc sp. LPT]